MGKEIKMQLKSAFASNGFVYSCIFSVLYAVVCFLINCIIWYGSDILRVPSANQMFLFDGSEFSGIIFSMILPFLAACGFADSFVSDYNSNYLIVNLSRTTAKRYYFSKMTAVFISAAFIIILPQIINFLFCIIAFPLNSSVVNTLDLWQADLYVYMGSENFLFRDLYVLSPYVYFVFYIILSGIAAGIIAVINFQASSFVKNKILSLSLMFIFINLFGIYCEAKMALDIKTYIFGFNISGMTYEYMIITFTAYILMAVLPIPFALRKVRNCI